jgi:hypothetical protein
VAASRSRGRVGVVEGRISGLAISWRRADSAGTSLGRGPTELGTTGLSGIREHPRLERLEPLVPAEESDEALPTLANMLPELREGAGEGVRNRGTGRVLVGD